VRRKEPDKIRVVLDTNVLVSALLSPLGAPGQIVSMTLQGQLQFFYNQEIINEYENVLSRPGFKFKSVSEERLSVLETLQKDGLICDNCISSVLSMQDESDRIFYDVANASEAFLITGNKKHYPDEPFIVTPRDFIDTVLKF
jgi:putative PIN family toxin of toxin-antitoxin system